MRNITGDYLQALYKSDEILKFFSISMAVEEIPHHLRSMSALAVEP